MSELKKIIDTSKLMIRQKGFKEYLAAVKNKIQHRDFTINDPSYSKTSNAKRNYKISKISHLNEEEENTLERKMVWLFGTPRSGTTWLGGQLLVHPENIIWYEPDIGLHLAVMAETKVTKNNEPKFERLYDEQRKRDSYFFSERHKKNWMPVLRKLILTRAFSESQTLDKNIIIKEPVGAQASEIIMECFPKSKLIFLVRDGRDVVDSRIDMHGKDTWAKLRPLNSEEDRRRMIRWYSFQWNQLMSRMNHAYDKHDQSRKILIRYEELRKDTLQVLKKIYDFLNVNISEKELEKIIQAYDFESLKGIPKGKGKFYRSASPGGWQKNFSNEEQELLNSIMEKTLKEFGYSN